VTDPYDCTEEVLEKDESVELLFIRKKEVGPEAIERLQA
jgi:hypothetical protein